MARTPKPKTDYELVSACRYNSSRASGSETAADELTESRTQALKYYKGERRGDEVDGESAVISMDVADTIHAMLAEMMPVFNTDSVVLFSAEHEEDEEQSLVESRFCNYQVMQKNKGYILFQTALKDALLSKNAIAKVYVDEKENIEKQRYKGLSEMEMLQLVEMAENPPQNTIIEFTKFDEKTGDVNIKIIKTDRKLMVECVAPENFAVSTDLRSPYIAEANYCRERFWRTRSELIEAGYDVNMVMDLPRSSTDTKIDSVTRNQIQDEQNYHAQTPEMETCELEEHYIRFDQDGDGIAELRKVVTCENHLLDNEEVDCIPYASGVVILMGHRFHGTSIFDLLRHLQDSKTMFLRQWHNNAYTNNHNTTDVVPDQVNMETFTTGRSSAIRMVDSLDSCRSNPVNDVGPSMQLALNYLDKVRTERVGSALDFQTNQIQTPHNVGDQGVNTLVENLEQISEWMLGTFAETFVTELFKLVHKYMRDYFPGEMQKKFGGQWTTTDPSQWMERSDVNTALGLTKGQRLRRMVALEKIIMKQEQLMMSGQEGVLADKEGYHKAVTDYSRMAGIENPEKYWIDPMSDQAKQAQEQNQMAQQQAQQEAMQAQNQLVQAQIADVMRQAEKDKAELQLKYDELEYKYNEMAQKTEVEEAKIVGGAIERIETAGMNEQFRRSSNKDNGSGNEAA